MTETTTTQADSSRRRKMAREPQAAAPADPDKASAAVEKPRSKSSLVLELLQRPDGASLDELVAATGWLPHTTRAALTGFRKKGHVFDKQKVDGVTRYTIAPATAQ